MGVERPRTEWEWVGCGQCASLATTRARLDGAPNAAGSVKGRAKRGVKSLVKSGVKSGVECGVKSGVECGLKSGVERGVKR